MALIPKFFIDCVVAIGVEINGSKNWIGTGFLFGYLFEKTTDSRNKYFTYLVTNKHVINNYEKIFVKFNPQTDQSSKDYDIVLKMADGSNNWTGHPDANIDIAVIPVDIQILIDEGMKFHFFQSDKHVLTSTDMAREGLSEGDFIYVLGFPMGILTSDRQYVFSRSGTISRISDLYEKRSKDFIIDAFVFPGNSGGPVLSKPEIVSIKGTKGYSHSKLIGIIKSYIPYTDIAYSLQTQKPRITFEENTGLTIVEPIEHVIETIIEEDKRKDVAQQLLKSNGAKM